MCLRLVSTLVEMVVTFFLHVPSDQDTYEVETEEQEDYDDVMPFENAGMTDTQAQVDVAVDAGTDSEAGTGVNADAEVVTTEVEVHAELK